MGHFTCPAQTKGAEKQCILSLKLQISFLYIQANTLVPTAVTDWATCAYAESCNWGIPVDMIQKGQLYEGTFQILLKWEDMSGRAKKISRCRRRSFSSCCSWTNALLLFTATAAGHLAAYSPSLNGRQYASSWLGRTLLPQCCCQATMNLSRQSACTTFWVPLLLWQLLCCTHN